MEPRLYSVSQQKNSLAICELLYVSVSRRVLVQNFLHLAVDRHLLSTTECYRKLKKRSVWDEASTTKHFIFNCRQLSSFPFPFSKRKTALVSDKYVLTISRSVGITSLDVDIYRNRTHLSLRIAFWACVVSVISQANWPDLVIDNQLFNMWNALIGHN